MLYPNSYTFRETSQKVTHPNTTPIQAFLTMEFSSIILPKRRCILLEKVVLINPYKPSFKHAAPPFHNLRISHSDVNLSTTPRPLWLRVLHVTTLRPLRPRVLHAHQLSLSSSPNHIVLGKV